jgi:hypothetical protein
VTDRVFDKATSVAEGPPAPAWRGPGGPIGSVAYLAPGGLALIEPPGSGGAGLAVAHHDEGAAKPLRPLRAEHHSAMLGLARRLASGLDVIPTGRSDR